MKKVFFPIIITAVFIVVYRIWIFSGGYLTAGDWPFYFQVFLKSFWGIPQIWESFSNLGLVDLVPAFDLFKFLYSVLSIYVNYGVSTRILYLWPIIIFTPLFSYIFLSDLLKNKFAIFTGILVFSFNTYYILLGTGDVTLMASFSFMPLIFYSFKKILEKNEFKWSLITTLALFFSTNYEPRATYVTVWILLFYFFYSILFFTKNSKTKSITKNIFFAFLPMFLTVILNFYWLFPLAHIGALTNNVLFARSLFGNQFLNINYAITLFHPFWTGGKPSIFIIQPIPFYFWLIPLFAFLGLLLNRENKNILFFGFIALLGILLTKQAAYPFNSFYLWLYEHVPGFNAFREASKFYPLIAFGYSVLIAFFINWLWENWKEKKWQKYGKYFITILIALIFLWNTKPFITGKVGYLFIPRFIPKDYLITKEYILKQSGYFRTLWVPISSRWSIYTNQHPEISLVNEDSSDWYKFFQTISTNSYTTTGRVINKFMAKENTHNLLNNSSIKYIFIPLEDKANDDNFFPDYGEPRQYYINALNKISWLKKINIGTKEIVVYKNPTYRPHIYTTFDKETITKNVPYQKIKYSFVSPTQYSLVLSHVKTPLYVNFSESYNSNWRMHIGNFNWLSVLTNKNYFLPLNWHFKNDARLNSFYIDLKVVCKVNQVHQVYQVESSGCVKNSDGTYTIYATLYFTPQSYMDLGLIISGVTLISILGYLGFIGILSFKNKYEKSK